MAQQNLPKLASEGRAFSATTPWSAEQLTALIAIEKECELQRSAAAEYIRNGITTAEGVKKAQEAKYVPKTMKEIQEAAVVANQKEVRKALGLVDEVSVEAEVVEKPKEAKKKATK